MSWPWPEDWSPKHPEIWEEPVKTFIVKYKTPHNKIYRRVWRAVSMVKGPDFWHITTASGRKVLIPVAGTIIFGRWSDTVTDSIVRP